MRFKATRNNRFFCVGAQKSATTTLHEILKENHEIFLPNEKETKFFVENYLYERGKEFYENSYFNNLTGREKILGEIDPDYLYSDRAPKRIFKCYRKSKIVILLRNPITRAYSHYLMTVSRGIENYSFERAIKAEPERLIKSRFNKLYYSYLARGLYAKQIKKYLRLFPRGNLKIILMDDFIKDTDKEIKDICKFLGVTTDFTYKKGIKANSAKAPKNKYLSRFLHHHTWMRNHRYREFLKLFFPEESPQSKIIKTLRAFNMDKISDSGISINIQQDLAEYYKLDVEELSSIIGRDLLFWLQ